MSERWLGELKPLTDFEWSFNPSIKKKQVYDLACCRFIRERRDVLWMGPPGVGKSFLVQALAYEAIKQGFVVLYRSIFDVVRDFLHEEALGVEEKVLARYLKPRIRSNVRVNPEMKVQRDHQVTMVFHYRDRNGDFVTRIELAPDEY